MAHRNLFRSGLVAATCALAILSVTGSSVNSATSTANLAMSANIPGSCTLSAAAIDFGAYSGATITPADPAAALTVDCNGAVAWTIKFDDGLHPSANTCATRRMEDSVSGDFLTYNIFLLINLANVLCDDLAANTFLSGSGDAPSPTSAHVQASLPGGQVVSFGSYADTVLMTLTFTP